MTQYSYNPLSSAELLDRARTAALNAYAPYSRFAVGAVVETDIGTFHGCNVENASYGLSICAERVALFAAISAGARLFYRLAVACASADSCVAAAPHGDTDVAADSGVAAAADGDANVDAEGKSVTSGASAGISVSPIESRMPCGACRQVIAEFMNRDAMVLVAGAGEWRVEDLLPNAFKLITNR